MTAIIIGRTFLIIFKPRLKFILIVSTSLLILIIASFHFSFISPSFNLAFFSDTLSFSIIVLTLISFHLISLSSFSYQKTAIPLSIILLILIMAFTANNTLLFYIFFEAVLIPTLFLITLNGSAPERLQAGIYLLLYTIFGSLPLLLSLLLTKNSHAFIISFTNPIPIQYTIFLILAFIIKLPIYFSHLWLPKAHVEAPLEGRIILAAVLLKLGGYGLIRLIHLFPLISSFLKNFLSSISLIGALFTRINCTRQKDLKALIAYSSVAHIGLVLAAILTFKPLGVSSAILIIFAHGLTSSALFFLVTILYNQTHSRNILIFKGILIFIPNTTFWWFIFTAANISAPPTINIIREIVIFSSLCQLDWLLIIPIFLASISTAAFAFILYSNIRHNTSSPLHPFNPSSSKIFLSLLTHLVPLVFIAIKPDPICLLFLISY